MYILAQNEYLKIEYLLEQVPFNCLFAHSVVLKHVNGTIYVDNTDIPQNAYILHPYGMALLLGNATNTRFENWLYSYLLNEEKSRRKDEWMQIFSDKWNTKMASTLSSKLIDSQQNVNLNYKDFIEVNRRVNFKFNAEKYLEFKNGFQAPSAEILRLDKQSTLSVQGTVVPNAFWNSAEDFIEKGIGFSIMINNEQVSTAYSAFIHDNLLEIGIETIEKYRGSSFAKLACSTIIDYCMGKKYTPVWSCRFENTKSFNLAIKLGFEPTLRLPYYRLCRD
jgi:hypothetical protein